MAHIPNEQQKKAIEIFDTDLLVSAGAGTGKTSVLTEKYLYLLKEGKAEVGEIVAITFTNKAATEMRLRIQQGVEEILNETTNSETEKFWIQQRRKLESARICTFHSLCLGLIKEHPLEAGIPPVSGILGDGEELLILNRAISEVLTEFHQTSEQEDTSFAKLLAEFGWDALLGSLRQVFQSIRESGQSISQVIGVTEENLKTAFPGVSPNLLSLIRLIEEFLEYSQAQKLTPHATEVVADFRQKWPEIKLGLSEQSILNQLINGLFEIKNSLPKNLPNAIKDRVVEIRALVEEFTRYYIDNAALSRLPLFEAILSGVDQHYRQLKLESGLLDFTDQQILTRNMLRDNPQLAAVLCNGIRYLLVDEFQDTNSLQLEIVKYLAGNDYSEGRWMAVGDVKQSIYRFRGAEAGLIVKLRQKFETGSGTIIALNQNYRSNPTIIHYINALSKQLFTNEMFDYEALDATQTDFGSKIEFLLNEDGAIKTQAPMVAARIQQLIEESKDTKQPLSYKDIVILFRTSSMMGQFRLALQELGIPYYMAGGTHFYQRQEIIDQMNLLRLIDQSGDGLALFALLKSPYVGLSDGQLLRLGRGRALIGRFYQEESETEYGFFAVEQERIKVFRETIVYLQQNREKLKISEIIRYALNKTNYLELCWLFTDASQRLANLEKLLFKADEFSGKGFFSTSAFLSYIKELEAVEAMENDAPTQGESNNVVRLMTVHRSKGLEFPVVILPDLDRRFRFGSQQRITFHKNIGLGFKITFGLDESLETSVWEDIKEIDRREEISELKRLLYVALTRAKRHLILAGSGRDNSKGDSFETTNNWMKWFQMIHPLPETGELMEFDGISIRLIRGLQGIKKPSQSQLLIEQILDAPANRSLPEITGVNEVASTQSLLSLKPVTLKASAIITFKDCPRRFFYRYLYGLSEMDLTKKREIESHDHLGAEIGTFLHQAARLQTKIWPEALWEKFVGSHGIVDPEKLRLEVNQMWEHFLSSEYADFKQTWDEVPFIIKLASNVRVEGRFDRLIINQADQLILVDYKTHRINVNEVGSIAKGYFWQLQLYALAVRELWGRLPDRAELYFVYPNRKIAVPLGPDALNQTSSDLQEMAALISTSNLPESYPQKDGCPGCSYQSFCLSST